MPIDFVLFPLRIHSINSGEPILRAEIRRLPPTNRKPETRNIGGRVLLHPYSEMFSRAGVTDDFKRAYQYRHKRLQEYSRNEEPGELMTMAIQNDAASHGEDGHYEDEDLRNDCQDIHCFP
ncbi:MAG TPA: hypothetical protein VFW05_17295 [Verrucomicrobiae bacterium]|nr:hypothetical protein [Verrucomicrobiae bacterium]